MFTGLVGVSHAVVRKESRDRKSPLLKIANTPSNKQYMVTPICFSRLESFAGVRKIADCYL